MREPDLARPIARHRLRVYVLVLGFTGLVFLGMSFGVGTGLIAPSFTTDVVANLLFGILLLMVPFVFWSAPGFGRGLSFASILREQRAIRAHRYWA